VSYSPPSEEHVRELDELTKDQARTWREEVDRLLVDRKTDQTKVREALLAAERLPIDKSNVSRFCKGDPGALRGWLLKDGSKAAALERILELEAGHFLALHRRIATGPATLEPALWHPAFPGVRPFDIVPPISGALGATLGAATSKVRKLLGASTAVRVAIVGAPGSGRRTTARLLLRACEGLSVDVRVSEEHGLRPGDLVVRTRPWGRDEVVELLRGLGPARVGASSLAERIEKDATIRVPRRIAARSIEWVAAALEDGPTADPDEAARRSAWERAVLTDESGALSYHGPSLMEAYWAVLLRAPASCDWARAPRSAAARALESALGTIGRGPTPPLPTAALMKRARSRAAKDRNEALELLEQHLHTRPVERLLQVLSETGLLTAAGDDFVAADRDVALSFGARGLIARRGGAGPDARLFLGEVGEQLARQLALAGGSNELIEEWARAVPGWAWSDVARFVVTHAAAAGGEGATKELVRFWATTVLTLVVEPTDPNQHRQPQLGELRRALAHLSTTTRSLPELRSTNPLSELLVMALPEARPTLEAWLSAEKLPADYVERELAELCPAQRLALTPAIWDALNPSQRERAKDIVIEKAPDRPDCARFLDGAALADGDADGWRVWFQLPASERLEWLGRAPGASRASLGHAARHLLFALAGDAGWLDACATPDLPGELEALLRRDDELPAGWAEEDLSLTGPTFNRHLGLWIRLAGRRERVTELQTLVNAAFSYFEDVTVSEDSVGLTLMAGGERVLQLFRDVRASREQQLGEIRIWLDLAHECAAVELHRLGHPETLLARWSEGRIVPLSAEFDRSPDGHSITDMARFPARERAASLLRRLGDLTPVRRWLECPDDDECPLPVLGLTELEAGWTLARTPDERRRIVARVWRPLSDGERAPAWLIAAGLQEPYEVAVVIGRALFPESPASPAAPSPERVAIAKRLVKLSRSPREGCWWALQLHVLTPWPPELLGALLAWSQEPDPFAERSHEHHEPWLNVGFPRRLAQLACAAPDAPWRRKPIVDLLGRLWKKAVQSLEKARPGFEAGWIADELARALHARNRFDEVVSDYLDRKNAQLRILVGHTIAELLDTTTLRREAEGVDGARERWVLALRHDSRIAKRAEHEIGVATESGDLDTAREWTDLLLVADPERALGLIERLLDPHPAAVQALCPLLWRVDEPLQPQALAIARRAAWASTTSRPRRR
jgi:hypothetical protein